MKFIYHSISLKGLREENEDEHIILKNLKKQNNDKYEKVDCICIYDGHGGCDVSKFLKKNIHKKIISNINYSKTSPKKYKKKIDKIFDECQNKIYEKEIYDCGSTALCCVIYKQKSYFLRIINKGDCRAILSNYKMNTIQLTYDHRPSLNMERKRIENLGGRIIYDGYCHRINGLSVSRAFGDAFAKPHISHFPDIYNFKLNPKDNFLVIACDGVWDFMTNDEVCNFIHNELREIKIKEDFHRKSNENIAYKLAKRVLEKGGSDNITLIIAFIK